MITTRSEKVALEIYRHIAKFDETDVWILMTGVAIVLSNFTIASGMPDEASVESFKQTLKDVRTKMLEDDSGRVH
jgi:hypothetical protein